MKLHVIAFSFISALVLGSAASPIVSTFATTDTENSLLQPSNTSEIRTSSTALLLAAVATVPMYEDASGEHLFTIHCVLPLTELSKTYSPDKSITFFHYRDANGTTWNGESYY